MNRYSTDIDRSTHRTELMKPAADAAGQVLCESDNCENRVLGWWTFPSWQIAYASRRAVGLGRTSAPHPGGTAFREASASCERPATRVRPANCLLEWPTAPGAQWTVTIRNRPGRAAYFHLKLLQCYQQPPHTLYSGVPLRPAASWQLSSAILGWLLTMHFLETVLIMTSSPVIAVTSWIQILDSPACSHSCFRWKETPMAIAFIGYASYFYSSRDINAI